jgi:hypothetical protein
LQFRDVGARGIQLFGNCEIVDAAGRASAGACPAATAGHGGLLASPHEEGVFTGPEFGGESDFVGTNADVLGCISDLLVLFYSGFAASDSAKASDLKFAVVMLSLELQEDEVRCGGAIGDILQRKQDFAGALASFERTLTVVRPAAIIVLPAAPWGPTMIP